MRLKTWMRAACMRLGPFGANRYRSKVHMTWVAHRAVRDRSMTCWETRRLAPFLTVSVHQLLSRRPERVVLLCLLRWQEEVGV